MKKFFHYLAAALLVGSSLAAVSCSDDPEDSGPTPNFPTPTEGTTEVNSAELYSIEIKPNMDWVVSLPTVGNPCFTLLDESGTEVTEVYTLRGKAVKDNESITIKVKAADVEVFEEMPPVELTMTMGNPAQSKTIATFIIPKKDREFKFYMAQIDEETGDYVYSEDGSGAYLYNMDDPKTLNSETSVTLEKHGTGIFYGVRMLVESNGSWTLAVPDWIDVRVNDEPATTGKAGQSEVELRANTAAPTFDLKGATDVPCKFFAKKLDNTDIDLAKLKVSMENLTALLECEGLPQEALFSARGNYLASTSTYGASLNGFITAPEGVQVIAIAKAMNGGYEVLENGQKPWVTTKIDPWDKGGELIQERNVSISLEPNTGNMERKAVIIVLPATLKDKKMADLLTEDQFDIRDEYKQYLVTTITQEASMFLFNPQNSLAMKQQGVKLELGFEMFDSTLRQWCDWMHNDNELYYKLTYTNEFSADGGAIDVVPSWCPSYTSYKIFGYNAGSAGENLPADNKWIQLQENRNTETNVVESFTVQMNFDDEYTNVYGDGKKYAAVVFYDENGTVIATLECTFDDGSGSGGGQAGAVSFAYPQNAQQDGSSIEMISAGDADYDKYYGAYADFTPSVYRVTFTKLYPTMSMISGLPNFAQWCEVIDGAEWLSRPEAGTEVTFAGLMNSEKSAKGACIFYTGGEGVDESGKVINPQGPAVIIVVELKLQ